MPPDGVAKTLLVIRHGETSWNRERRIMGAADVPLSVAGREQCSAVAGMFRHFAEAGFSVDSIVTSPLARARESAGIIGASLGIEIREDEDLQEVRFGRWQGMTYEEVMRDPDYAAYARDPCASATPGGETILDVQARGLAALERGGLGRRTLFVSHGDIIRSTICHYLAIPAAEYRRVRIDNCGLSAVDQVGASSEVKFVNLLADPERVWDPLHWSTSS
jgi:broad specificity phosphatase PhoE